MRIQEMLGVGQIHFFFGGNRAYAGNTEREVGSHFSYEAGA